MKVLLSWLREFAPIRGDTEEIADTLSDLGMAVEDVQRLGADLDGIVVARVLATRRHPNADRIQLVDVDAGDGEALQICCGAFNMAAGDLVPLATVGTTMPDGRAIARAKLRGEWSNGMLCSGRELGLERRPRGHPRAARPGSRRARICAGRSISEPTCSSTSTSPATGPRRCRWSASPGTWPPARGCPSPCPNRSVVEAGRRARRGGPRAGRDRGPRPLRPLRGPGAARASTSGRAPPGWPTASSPSACGRSTTSSTPPTT